MAARPSLEELLEDVSQEKLGQPCTDEHLCEIAGSVTNWKSIAPFLGISEAEEEEIEIDSGKTGTQRSAMLRKWKKKFGRKATYWRLASVFWRQERADLVDRIRELLLGGDSSDGGSPSPEAIEHLGVLELYTEYLQGRYLVEIPPFALQWPPPPTRKVFNLAMIHTMSIQRGPIDEEFVRLTLRGNVDDIMQNKTAVKLQKIFKLDETKRKVILIEGAPGAGKSTLAWHACQQWASLELFQEFQVVVFVQLRDPAVQSARSIADILPCTSNSMRRDFLSKLEPRSGNGVLFVLDGWDEYSKGLSRGALFFKLICTPGALNMHKSTLLITSRPVASGNLRQYCSARIEIVGFAPEQVKEYFTESLEGDLQVVLQLHECLKERPVIQASCYLPLNAAIVVHLFLDRNHTLPSTLHGVFTSLVLSSIVRHLRNQQSEDAAEERVPKMESFDQIPTEIQPHFNSLCTLAFNGIKENRVSFSEEELQALNLPTESNTMLLSLIQGVPSFRSLWEDRSYNFLHLSIQELLAAYYISRLSPSAEVEVFKELFGQPRFNAVLQFYAAFSKFQVEGIQQFLREVLHSRERSRHQEVILDCLYEAQDPSLCQYIGMVLEGKLNVSYTVSPLHCLAIAYFLHCNILCVQEFRVEFHSCGLDEYKFSYFTNELKKCSGGRLSLDLADNDYRWPVVASSLVSMVQESCSHCVSLSLGFSGNSFGAISFIDRLKPNSVLKALDLSKCTIQPRLFGKALHVNVNKSLEQLTLSKSPGGVRNVIELLKTTSTLKALDLSCGKLGSQRGKEFAEALTINRSLEVLVLSCNDLSDFSCGLSTAHHLARALRSHPTLRRLDLVHCSLMNHTARAIAEGAAASSSLQELDLTASELSDFGLDTISQILKKSRSLQKVTLFGVLHMEECASRMVSIAAMDMFVAEMKSVNIHVVC